MYDKLTGGGKEGRTYGLLISLASISCLLSFSYCGSRLPLDLLLQTTKLFSKSIEAPVSAAQLKTKTKPKKPKSKCKENEYYNGEWVTSNAKPEDIHTAANLILEFSLLLVLHGKGVTSQTIQNVFSLNIQI